MNVIFFWLTSPFFFSFLIKRLNRHYASIKIVLIFLKINKIYPVEVDKWRIKCNYTTKDVVSTKIIRDNTVKCADALGLLKRYDFEHRMQSGDAPLFPIIWDIDHVLTKTISMPTIKSCCAISLFKIPKNSIILYTLIK